MADERTPYMLKLVSDWLRVSLGVRVVSQPPPERLRASPWIMVHQLPADHNYNDPTDRVIEFNMSFQCYAGRDGGMPEAERLSRGVCDQIIAMGSQKHEAPTDDDLAVVVGRTAPTNGPFSQPDTDMEPQRDRYIVDAVLYAHTTS